MHSKTLGDGPICLKPFALTKPGDSLDARVVILTLPAGVIQPGVVKRYGLDTG